MARPGLMRHRKFIRLSRLIGSEVAAIGHLEIIWQASYETGDALIGTAEDVEFLAKWTGESGALARALVDSGFIDVDDSGAHSVHDLLDHAPDYVRRRMEREDERRRQGTTISELRAKAGKRGGTKNKRKQMTSKRPSLASVCLSAGEANGATPAPAPAPAPAPISPPNPPQAGGSDDRPCQPSDEDLADARSFARAWVSAECPQHLKPGCLAAFERLIVSLGKDAAIKRVQTAMGRHATNPFAYAESVVTNEAVKAAMKPAKTSQELAIEQVTGGSA